jgi:hypothetical protein
MKNFLNELFDDKTYRQKTKNKLPYLFHIAELESSRAGKIGMEVGSTREKILIALLISKFGVGNVETEIPITESEVDVKLFDKPISIKTITGKGGVKVIWTVDAQKARQFCDTYAPTCDILLAQINWNNGKLEGRNKGGLFWIPLDIQKRILQQMGNENYLTPPKPGTNPRGVEISRNALERLLQDNDTKYIEILWQRPEIKYNPYERWVDYWNE